MKKKISIQRALWFIFIVGLLGSCVPMTKFAEQKHKTQRYETENDSLISANEQLTVSNKELRWQIERCAKDLEQMIADSVERARTIAELRMNNRRLENNITELNNSMDALKKGSEREASKFMMQIEGMQNDLQNRENELQKLSKEITDKQNSLLAMERELEKRNRRTLELERLISRQDSAVKALKAKISAALVGLENNGLTVRIHQGKVYVSLDEKLLFKSGSITVEPEGVKALKSLIRVLEQNPEINITIEGHTDNVPLRANASMQDNWDLSVKRATSIVRILLDGTKIAPARLTASGRSEYIPVDSANTPEARQKNRRTEIILTPKLDELYQMLE